MRRSSMGILVLAVLALSSPCFAQSGKDALIANEKAAWESLKTKKIDAFASLLGKDFIAVDQDGAVGKSEEIKLVAEFDLKDYALADIKVIMVNKGTAVLTYKVTQHGTYKGQVIPANLYASSVVVNRGGKWVVVFHQETTAGSAPAL
jgi:hypothetical protein